MRTRPQLQSSDAKRLMDACRSEAQKMKLTVSIAIVDDNGIPLLIERMDGAGPLSVEAAFGKAKASALTRRPTKFWEDRIKERPAFIGFPGGLMIQGALPIMHRDECVGAIGVSGAQSGEDEQIAAAGIEAARDLK
ncbi:MAG TPA: heme-binding protein [Bauldia sp.]|nr:heme-binding protein [Bauldia sp.]